MIFKFVKKKSENITKIREFHSDPQKNYSKNLVLRKNNRIEITTIQEVNIVTCC